MKVCLLTLCIFLVIISGCKKSSIDSDSTAVEGLLLIIDETNRPTSNYSGVTISSENPDIPKIDIDANGKFTFPELVNTSAYLTLRITKPGYGTVTQYYTKAQLDSFSNERSTVTPLILLPQSSVIVNSLSGKLEGDKFTMVCNVTLDQVKATNGVTFFLTKNIAQVTYDNYTGNNAHSRSWTVPVNSGDNLSEFCFKRTIECDCDFLSSGDTVYLRAYGNIYSPFANGYLDSRTGQLKFPSINANASSSTISFVVP